ncbi:hypothetical protein ANTQUA_LOCUS2676 [Anthophora quadrimaculata]
MGKKGSKRKTRWRTLSIGAPPGEEDEEEGLRNGFVNGQENDTSTHSFSRNGQSGGYKSWRTRSNDDGGARHNESSGSPSQPKIIFNEDEYTRITTPRQDMLFKKGYLSRKKPWARNTNTSATSSTTESQSASHSTAGRDGSETTEDQQLLDRDCTTGEYTPMMDSGAQLGYGAFYDHANSYFYEYPVMLVGPAPIPTESNILTAVPCAPVPLRPIEWVSPAFVPKLTGQPYCMMNYKTNQSTESTVVMEEQENTMLPMDNANGTCNESGTGSASCSGSVAGETEKQSIEFNNSKEEQHADEQLDKPIEDQYGDEQQVEEQPLENGLNGGPYFQPMLMQQPVHVSHVIPAVPQPYMYPGHYMFGPPFINVNGVTIQGGPMIRTMDFAAMSTACAKRRKKYKRRKQRRLAAGNTEDEEEGEYSSEGDTGVPYSRMPWTACSTSTTTTTTTSNWPLNPECREFQLQQVVETHTSLSAVPTSTNTLTSEESSTVNQQSSTLSPDVITSVDNENNEPCNGLMSDDSKNPNDESITDIKTDQQVASASTLIENNESTSLNTANNSDDEANRLTNCLPGDEEAVPSTNEVVNETTEMEKLPSTTKAANNNSSSANEPCERPSNEMMNGETLVNGKLDSDSNNEDNMITTTRTSSPQKETRSRSVTPKSVENIGNREKQNHESLTSSKSSSSTNLSKRKYSAKGSKFVREPTPGPDLDNTTEPENEIKIHDLSHSLDKMNLSNDSKQNIMFDTCNDKTTEGEQVSDKLSGETVCNHVNREDPVESMNEDSGFESQTRLSDYPITEAVTEWLRRANSPDMFITPAVSMDCEEDEDEDDVDEEPPKNLQGNPMPALSANSSVDNTTLSRTASYSEFARISNIKGGQEQQQQQPDGNNSASRKKKDPKRRSEERRRVVRHTMDGKLDHEVVSSSDSCGQLEDPMNIARRKNPARQQQQQQQQQPQQQQQNVADDNCEFTEKDSVAGMRVALSSRMDSKRVNARRTKRQGRSHPRDPVNNIDTKIRRIEDVDDENDEGIVKDTMNVRTFEKGEIVVSKSGKLLTTSVYEASLHNCHDVSTVIKTIGKNETGKQKNEKKTEESKRSSSDEEEESASGIGSLDSIEEPDVLECWEAEVIVPVITPKRMLQSEGVLCEGEAAEDDTIEVEQVNIDYVQKYYRLARESASSVEEKMNLKANPSSASLKSVVPNKSEQMEEVQTHKELDDNNDNIPIDEAFEVYESCYTGKAPFLSIDSKVFKPRTLYGQDGETPIPCRAVCCNLQ